MILKKKENSLETRDSYYKFRYFRFLASQNLQNLQLNQPPINWLNSPFQILRIKKTPYVKSKDVTQNNYFFQFIQLAENQHILINSY